MKVKLDENLGTRGVQLLTAAGWNVSTVVAQDLCSVADATLAEICRVELQALPLLQVLWLLLPPEPLQALWLLLPPMGG